MVENTALLRRLALVSNQDVRLSSRGDVEASLWWWNAALESSQWMENKGGRIPAVVTQLRSGMCEELAN